jgi:hypothetical protein
VVVRHQSFGRLQEGKRRDGSCFKNRRRSDTVAWETTTVLGTVWPVGEAEAAGLIPGQRNWMSWGSGTDGL